MSRAWDFRNRDKAFVVREAEAVKWERDDGKRIPGERERERDSERARKKEKEKVRWRRTERPLLQIPNGKFAGPWKSK